MGPQISRHPEGHLAAIDHAAAPGHSERQIRPDPAIDLLELRHGAGPVEVHGDHAAGLTKHQAHGLHEAGIRQLGHPVSVVGGVAPVGLHLAVIRIDGSLEAIAGDQPPIGIDGLELA